MALDLRDRIKERLKSLVQSPLPQGERAAQVLAIASSKGGVGKTTTAVNLAASYARRGKRVLIVDLDPQAHVAASLHVEPASVATSLADVLLGKNRDVLEAVRNTRFENLSLAGSEKGLAETETVLGAKIGKELILDGALVVTRSHFDLVVIDCPPNLGTLTLNALCAADYLLIPTDMSVLALEGVGDILTAVDTVKTRLGRRVEVLGILATRYDRRATQMNDAIVKSFHDLHAERLLSSVVPQSSALNKAHLAGKPAFEFAKGSPGAVAYEAVADELAPRLGFAAQAVLTMPARAHARTVG